MSASRKRRLVVLISGRGSNLQAILDGVASGELAIELCAVISNRPAAGGLQRAEQAGVATAVLDHKQFPDRRAFEQALRELIDSFKPDLVALAGFMRVLGDDFVRHYEGRMLNIHPSLLPKYPGLHTHERAIAAGDRVHGASVHFVTPELDSGPTLVQAQVPVLPTDDPDTLAARVLVQEHRLYPLALRWIAEGRVSWREQHLLFDGQLLAAPIVLDASAGEPNHAL